MCSWCATSDIECFCGTSLDPSGSIQRCGAKENPHGGCPRCEHAARREPADRSSYDTDYVEYD
jgi:hypothetical protein